jgi:hypothetical protein
LAFQTNSVFIFNLKRSWTLNGKQKKKYEITIEDIARTKNPQNRDISKTQCGTISIVVQIQLAIARSLFPHVKKKVSKKKALKYLSLCE